MIYLADVLDSPRVNTCISSPKNCSSFVGYSNYRPSPKGHDKVWLISEPWKGFDERKRLDAQLIFTVRSTPISCDSDIVRNSGKFNVVCAVTKG